MKFSKNYLVRKLIENATSWMTDNVKELEMKDFFKRFMFDFIRSIHDELKYGYESAKDNPEEAHVHDKETRDWLMEFLHEIVDNLSE